MMKYIATACIDKASECFYTPRKFPIPEPPMTNLPKLVVKSATPELAALKHFHWTHQIVFSLYGARIGVQTNDATAFDLLIQFFPPHWREAKGTRVDCLFSLDVAKSTSSGRRPFYSLYRNGERVERTRKTDRLTNLFEHNVQLAVAENARQKTFVHAGAVGWKGHAIIIPGISRAGKSTLVRELVRAGAEYFSDEYAVLDTRGRVHPFARQLALRDASQVNRKMSFQELGGVIATKPLPVSVVLVAKYRAGAKWRPRTLSPGVGSLEILANTVTARTKQVLVLETLKRVTQNALILKGNRDEARVFVPKLLAHLTELFHTNGSAQ
jgi:hypothetical protein